MSVMADTIADLGEFGVIAHVTQGLDLPPAVSLGPGDDAAAFLVNGSAVVSTDILVENQHFRTSWSTPADVGRKAVAVNAADIEAMGAEPVAIVVAFACPDTLEAQWLREFTTGLRDEAAKAGLALVGGDVSRARDITVSVTAIGQTAGQAPITRAGAQPGDAIAVCGTLGWAGAGLAALQRGFRSPRAVVQLQRVPQVPYGQGRVAAQAGAHAMIDISDGLLADLGHIADASKVVLDIDTARFSIAEPLQAVASATGVDPLKFILTGGEDHSLAATFPLGQVPDKWQVIGRVLEEGEPAVLVDGEPWEGAAGWDHFRR